MIAVETQITVEEVNGRPPDAREVEVLAVRSHRTNPRKVILSIPDEDYTVDAQELVRAVTNAWQA
jgi:hypothetical protein